MPIYADFQIQQAFFKADEFYMQLVAIYFCIAWCIKINDEKWTLTMHVVVEYWN